MPSERAGSLLSTSARRTSGRSNSRHDSERGRTCSLIAAQLDAFFISSFTAFLESWARRSVFGSSHWHGLLETSLARAKVKRLGREDFLASGGDLARWVARALGDG